MRSPSISAPEGFSLIELVIVIGLMAAATAGLGLGGEALVLRLRRSEEATLLSALRTARAEAMRNVGRTAHGVHYDADQSCRAYARCFIVFNGDRFDPVAGGVEFESNGAVRISWPEHDPVFRNLDGAAERTSITLERGGRVTHIDIGYEGRIDAR